MVLDDYGRATDCFAFAFNCNRYICTALNEFYNADIFGNEELCLECPFYKPRTEVFTVRSGHSVSRADLHLLRSLVHSGNPSYKKRIEALKKLILPYISGIENIEVREHVYLYYVKGKTCSEIAGLTDNVISSDTVAKRIQREIKKLP